MLFVGNTWIYTDKEINQTKDFIKTVPESNCIYFCNMFILMIQDLLQFRSDNIDKIKSTIYHINVNKLLENALYFSNGKLQMLYDAEWDSLHLVNDSKIWIDQIKDKKVYTFWFDPSTYGFIYHYYNETDFNSNEDYQAYLADEYNFEDPLSKLLSAATLNNYMMRNYSTICTNNNLLDHCNLKSFKDELPIAKEIDKYIFNLK